MILKVTDFTAFQAAIAAMGGSVGSLIFYSLTGGNVNHAATFGLSAGRIVEGDFSAAPFALATLTGVYSNNRDISPTFTVTE